jgi:hypothetical protein
MQSPCCPDRNNLKPGPLKQPATSRSRTLLELAGCAVGAQPKLKLGDLRCRESVSTE